MKKNILYALFITVLIVLVIFITNISGTSKTANNISTIIQNENIVLIDVRTEEEYKSGHIPRAINVPNTKIENVINYDKETPVAVYWRTGKRSKEAALTLEKMGYTKIYDLGSINNYKGELTTN